MLRMMAKLISCEHQDDDELDPAAGARTIAAGHASPPVEAAKAKTRRPKPAGLCFQPGMPAPRSNPKWTKTRLRTKPARLKQVTTAKSETPRLETGADGRTNL
jgi:hypothetical protein